MGLFRDFYEPDPADFYKEDEGKTCRSSAASTG